MDLVGFPFVEALRLAPIPMDPVQRLAARPFRGLEDELLGVGGPFGLQGVVREVSQLH